MKILFTADWHIKLGQKNVPKEWAKARYYEFFKQVHELEESVDLHIIGGDIFDRTPTLDELKLLFEFIQGIKVPTWVYDGNHEATKKGQSFLHLISNIVEMINPLVVILTTTVDHGEFIVVPYTEIHKKGAFDLPAKPLFTHVRGEIPPHVKPEIDLDLLDKFPVVFAGDLHSHSNCQRNIVYPGSPMTTSFHRSEVKTGYIIIEDDWSWKWGEFKLPQLIRKTVSDPELMIPTEYHHTIYELEGDSLDLSNIKANDLLDKKLVKKSSEARLVLTKNMSIRDELVEYLTYILEIPEDKLAGIMGEFNDYFKNIEME